MAGVIINILAKGKYSTTEIITKKRIKFFSVTNENSNEYNTLLNAILNSLNGSATMLKINIQSNYIENVKRLISNSEKNNSSSLEKTFLSKLNEISDKKYIKIEELSSYQKFVLEKHLNAYIEGEKERIKLEKEQKKCNTELLSADNEAELENNGDDIIEIITTEEEIVEMPEELIGFDESFDPDSIIIGEEFKPTSPDVINIDDL